MSSDRQDQQLRDDVQELKITVKQVIQPTLTSVAEDVKSLAQGGFITRKDADALYAPKDDVKFLKNLLYGAIAVVVGQFVGLLVIFFKYIIGAAH